jgi:hypothetical protein
MWKRVCLHDTKIVVAASSVLVVISRFGFGECDGDGAVRSSARKKGRKSSIKGSEKEGEPKAAIVQGNRADDNWGRC